VFAGAATLQADTLYVIGGLYGNLCALDAIEEIAAREPLTPTLVFNGDFHWFDAESQLFAEVQQRVLKHVALRGNVETELAGDDSDAGCGCAYPDSVPDADVERSNSILRRLRGVATQVAGARAALAAAPMTAVAAVGALRVGIVHGDAWSLAGWRFAHDALHGDADQERLARAFEQAAVDGFASTHTCLPALKALSQGFVVNNGAAGMGNFAGDPAGVITRISTRAAPAAVQPLRLYGLHERGVWIDALRVPFDTTTWLARFDAIWPAGSAAAVSYRERLANGAAFSVEQALGRAASASACANSAASVHTAAA
jgi:hypothetical protein